MVSVSQEYQSQVRIHLLGGFAVRNEDTTLRLTSDSERLIAFLALQSGRVPRAFVAGSLWPDGTQDRAFGNLRSSLWRLRGVSRVVVDGDSQTLAISYGVTVDLREVKTAARGLVGENKTSSLPSIEAFTADLLPGWYDEWALVERERHRQLSLHALEALSERLTSAHRFGAAIEAALAAIELDPLRESANRQLIEVHLAEGNYSEAMRHYARYKSTLHADLGIQPSPLIEQCLERIVASA